MYTDARLLLRLGAIMDKYLLRQLVCPYSGCSLVLHEKRQELWCLASKMAYPIKDGMPLMLIDEARLLSDHECELFLAKGDKV